MTGFRYLVAEIAALATVTALAGLLVGRYLVPSGRRTRHPRPSGAGPADLEPALTKLERRLRASEAEVDELRRAVAEVSDGPDDDLTSLGPAAESIITTYRGQLAELQAQVRRAGQSAREHQERFEAERLLTDRLRTVIAARDEQIAELTHQLSTQGGAGPTGSSGPPPPQAPPSR